jgi:hypothetical protein
MAARPRGHRPARARGCATRIHTRPRGRAVMGPRGRANPSARARVPAGVDPRLRGRTATSARTGFLPRGRGFYRVRA